MLSRTVGREFLTVLARTPLATASVGRRFKTHFRSGAIRAMPDVLQFGYVSVLCSVLPGLFIGAAISKSVANFLEENDLFVPSDDDDDED